MRLDFVADVMREGIHTCAASATLREVARTMADRRIHCVVVTGLHADDVWGVVSDLDLARAAGGDLDQLTAGEVAASEVVTVPPSATIDQAAQLMAEHDVAHLLVVIAESGRPIGIVSTLDIARALGRGA
jgi:CBS domain-containing protein